MSDPDKTNPGTEDADQEENDRLALEDLDAGDDAEKVIGGTTGCPCMGGDIRRR